MGRDEGHQDGAGPAGDPEPRKGGSDKLSGRIARLWDGTLDWAKVSLPPGARLPVGLLLMLGGVFGFLPVLGFWMIPLGAAVAFIDLRPAWKKVANRIEHYHFSDIFARKRDRHGK